MRKLVSLEEKKNLLHARSLVCFQFPPFLPVYTDSRESGIDIADKQRKVLTILFFIFRRHFRNGKRSGPWIKFERYVKNCLTFL